LLRSNQLLASENLLSYFDFATCQKGLDYARKGKVASYSVRADRQTGQPELVGKVVGHNGNTYRVDILLSADGADIEHASCSCPMAIGCKHCVAITRVYLDKASTSFQTNTQAGSLATISGAEQRRAQSLAISIVETSDATKGHAESSSLSSAGTIENLKLTRPPADLKESFQSIAELHKPMAKAPAGCVGDLKPTQSAARAAIFYILKSKLSMSCNPCIEAVAINIKKDGSFGASKPVNLRQAGDQYYAPKSFTAADTRILKSWQHAVSSDKNAKSSYYYLCGSNYDYENFADATLLHSLLVQMVGTGRCHVDSIEGPSLSFGPTLEGQLVWKSGGGLYWLSVEAARGEERLPCLRWKFPYYFDTENATFGQVNLPVSPVVLAKLLAMRAVKESELAAVPVLLAESGLNDLVPPPPGHKAVIVRQCSPAPELFVRTSRCRQPILISPEHLVQSGENVRVAEMSLPKAALEAGDRLVADADGNLVLERYETSRIPEYIDQLRQRGFRHITSDKLENVTTDSHFFVAEQSTWLKLDASAIAQLRASDWRISEQTEAQALPIDLTEKDLEFAAEDQDGAWWFSLSLNIDVNGLKVPLLPLLVSAIRRLPSAQSIVSVVDALNSGGKFVAALPDGQLVSLPFDRVRAILVSLQELLNNDHTGDKLNVSLLHAADLLADSFLSNALWTGADRIKSLVERLRRLTRLEPVPTPRKFKANLRSYQQEGLGWLQFLAEAKFGGILADDMGLGKTVQLLAHICLEKQEKRLDEPFLVVCPTSVLPNWLLEAKKFAPHLKVLGYSGADRFLLADSLAKADLVVTTYPLLTRDIESLKRTPWHGVALDEAQAIKNPSAQIAGAARSLKAGYRFCLTGTPIENHLGELWSQFQFLLPGLLGDHATFTRRVRTAIEKGGDQSLRAALAARVRPFILRRTKQQVLSDLPEKTIVIQPIELDEAQRDLYETVRIASTQQIRDEVAKKGFKQSQIMILDALLKLRQVCCDARLVKLSAAKKVTNSAKLEQLLQMLSELSEEGRKILIFSQFTSMLDLIAPELDRLHLPYVELRGDTRDRTTPVERFQNGDVPIFLLSLKAGGTGLNLTAADVVIHFDPWWNPAVEDQATDRAHRIGQSKKVFVYKLIAQGTIEQRMIELQERKRSLANCIYDASGGLSLSFSEHDLEALLKPME
jgi:superfamily II DNA or RNA helicase